MKRHLKNIISRLFHFLLITVSLAACTQPYSYLENDMPAPVNLSDRLTTIFSKTKVLCFGRYTIEVPIETKIIYGSNDIPNTFEVLAGGRNSREERITADAAKILENSFYKPEIVYNGPGDMKDTWQLRYYDNQYSKKDNNLFFHTYVSKGDLTFILGDVVSFPPDSEAATIERQISLIKRLRLRTDDEVPTEPGFCTDHAFVASEVYDLQETTGAGFYFPSFPDVSFSVSSNKDAYGDLPKDDYENRARRELSLLNRIEAAKKDQGLFYPRRTLLREGKRLVQHWHGEESLIKRPDGVHDFEWALVGTPKDVVNPAILDASMFTKVAHDTVGAADKPSLTDEEAVAMWDKLLSSLKFRVKVPGAPPGSYLFDPDHPAEKVVTK